MDLLTHHWSSLAFVLFDGAYLYCGPRNPSGRSSWNAEGCNHSSGVVEDISFEFLASTWQTPITANYECAPRRFDTRSCTPRIEYRQI